MASCTKVRCSQPEKAAQPARAPTMPKPLPATTRREMEPAFGCDLSHVRVQDGVQGDEVARQHDSRAVALGGSIYFGRGEFQPHSPEGSQVLKHEVAHAIQQTKSGPTTTSTDQLESEAELAAAGATGISLSAASPSIPLTLRRGQRPTGPPSRGIARSIQRQLERDPEDQRSEARSQLGALAPRVRSEVAEQVRDRATPDQRVSLRLDSSAAEPPSPIRTGPATQEPERAQPGTSPATPAPVRETAGEPTAPTGREAAHPRSAASSPPVAASAIPTAGGSQPLVQAAPMVTSDSVAAPSAPTVDAAGPAATEGPAMAPAGGGPAAAAPIAAPPQPPSAPSPDQNPAFQSVRGGIASVATAQRAHTPAAAAASTAQRAAQSPANEREGIAQANQSETMAAQQTNPFDRQAFRAALLARVQSITPNNLGEADEFRSSGRAGEIQRDVAGQVQAGTTQASGGLPEATSATPDTSAIPARVADPLQSDQAGAAPTPVPAGGAVQAARPEAQVNLDNGPQQIDGTMAQAGVTPDQLQNSNEPSFQGALAARDQARQHSETAPGEFRATETSLLSAEQQQAATIVGGDLQRMHTGRGGALAQATGQQNDARTRTEQQRQTITAEINRRFGELRTTVEARLARVSTEANAAFDTGAERARTAFERYVGQRMDAYRDDRYSGELGWARWLGDKLMGLPDEVNAFYTEGRDAYLADMDAVIDEVAGIVETGLTEATNLIQNGRTEIHTYVISLPEDLQGIAGEAESALADQFAQLEQSVTDQRDQLVESLAQRYVQNVQAIDERINQMQAANRGLVDAALDAMTGIINTIRDLANTLLGVLSRAASAIGAIIRDPIGFLGNLVSAIGQGLRQFLSNIGHHLLNGLMGWLFGALASAGIQMPTSFDLRSILGLVLQILGLTYANFRSRAVRILGEGVVRALETTAEIFTVLVTEGPAGLFRWMANQFEALKEQVMSQIREFIMERVIVAGVQWIIGLLNPASAFVRACLAIKDIVVFFIERGRQILDLVNAVIDSVTAIASGNLTSAANWVENALARSIPVLISMLASLLGLGGISERIRAIIERIQAPINNIIDSLIRGAASLVRSIGRALGFGRQPENQSPSDAVKEVAAARLRERLRAEHQLPEIRTIVGGVLAELRPQGLLNLEVGPAAQDGAHPILASASATVPIGNIIPPRQDDQGERVAVAMNGIIEFATAPTITPGEVIERDALYSGSSGASERVANSRTSLGVVNNFAAPNTIVTRTWNGGRTHSDIGNQTHAEHHFVSWLNSNGSVKNNMTRLDVILNPLGPCKYCANELTDLVRTRKHQNAAFVANIMWTQQYVDLREDWNHAVPYANMNRAFNGVQGPGNLTQSEVRDTLRWQETERRGH